MTFRNGRLLPIVVGGPQTGILCGVPIPPRRPAVPLPSLARPSPPANFRSESGAPPCRPTPSASRPAGSRKGVIRMHRCEQPSINRNYKCGSIFSAQRHLRFGFLLFTLLIERNAEAVISPAIRGFTPIPWRYTRNRFIMPPFGIDSRSPVEIGGRQIRSSSRGRRPPTGVSTGNCRRSCVAVPCHVCAILVLVWLGRSMDGSFLQTSRPT